MTSPDRYPLVLVLCGIPPEYYPSISGLAIVDRKGKIVHQLWPHGAIPAIEEFSEERW